MNPCQKIYGCTGPDHTQYRVHADDLDENVDKIEEYWNGRYLSTGEAAWRILGYTITKKEPSVTPISVHLPSNHVNH